mmetsp:Transcript_107721/g.314949  ORF Transcript_107721/g.314949 Transcript_107721/m.314949 type:complete len:202 (-) Transcript_107721:16-621(-)
MKALALPRAAAACLGPQHQSAVAAAATVGSTSSSPADAKAQEFSCLPESKSQPQCPAGMSAPSRRRLRRPAVRLRNSACPPSSAPSPEAGSASNMASSSSRSPPTRPLRRSMAPTSTECSLSTWAMSSRRLFSTSRRLCRAAQSGLCASMESARRRTRSRARLKREYLVSTSVSMPKLALEITRLGVQPPPPSSCASRRTM